MTPDVIVSYAIYGIVGALALFGMLLGLIRGVMRSLVRLITVSASFGAAFAVTVALKDSMLSIFDGKTLSDLLTPLGIAVGEGDWVGAITMDTVKTLLTLPAGLVVLPFLFVALFLIINFFMLIIHKILCGIMGYTRANNNEMTRLLGAAVGAVQGAIIALVILIPVSGTINTFASAVNYVAEKYPDRNNTQALVSTYDQFFKASEDNVVLDILAPVSDALYPSFTVFEIDGEQIDVRECVNGAAVVLVNLGDIAATDWKELTDTDKAAIDSMVDVITENRYYATVVSGILSALGEFNENDSLFDLPEPLGSFVDCIFDIMKTSNRDNISGDLDTLIEVLYLISDSGTLRTLIDGGNALESFIQKDSEGVLLYNKFNAVFNANPRFSGITTAINDLAFEMLLQNNNSDLPVEEVIEDVKTGINDVLSIEKESYETPEEYREAVTESLETTLKSNDIELTDDQMEKITDYVINDMEDVEEVTDAEIAEFIAKYYEIYAQMQGQ